MEDNEYTSIKDILEWCEREGVRKVSELTQEEFQAAEAEQIARYRQGRLDDILQSGAYKLVQLFEENAQVNKHNIAAQAVLLKALEDASNDPAMESSPEVKRIADLFHRLINYRRASFSFAPEAIFEQILEPHEGHIITEATRHAAKAPRKKTGKDAALLMYEEWAAEPVKFKNQTQFTKAVKAAKHCDSKTTALDWLNQFRTTQPCEELEKILPSKK